MLAGGTDIDHLQLQAGIALPFIFFHGEHHIERSGGTDAGKFFRHKKSYAG